MASATRKLRGVEVPRISVFLFFGFFIGGVTAIILMKIGGVAQVWVTAVPVLLMFVYAGVMMALRSQRVRMDQAGDNLYYLGFLYTLASLAYSLYQFGTSADAASNIIENFGIAIASTIFGLMFRVLFNQMRSDPAETEALARVELAEAARRMRGELDRSAIDFSAYRRALQQNIMEAYETLHEEVAKTLEGAFMTLEADVGRVSSSAEKATEVIDGASKRFKNRTEALAGELETLSEKVASVDVPSDMVSRKIEPAAEAMTQAVAALREASERERAEDERRLAAMKDVQEAGERLKTLLEESRAASEATREAMASLHGGVNELGDFKATLATLSSTLSEFGPQLSREIEGASERLSKAGKSAAEESAAALERLHAADHKAAEAIVAQINEGLEAMRAEREAFEATLKETRSARSAPADGDQTDEVRGSTEASQA